MKIQNNSLNENMMMKSVTTAALGEVFKNSLGNNSQNSGFTILLQSLMGAINSSDNNVDLFNSNLPGVKLESLDSGLNDIKMDLLSNNLSNSSRSYGVNAYNNTYASSKCKVTTNNSRIQKAVENAANKHGINKNLILSVIKQESDFNPYSKSWAGAMGLMQLMPENCKDYGVSDPYNIEQNIDAGTRHLKDMIKLYKGNLKLGLAAYNAGCGTLSRRGVNSVDKIVRLPKETREYVKKVMNYYGKSSRS